MPTTHPDEDVTRPDLYLIQGGRAPAASDERSPTDELAEHRARALAAADELPDGAALSHVSAACLLDLPIWHVPLLNGPVLATRPRPGVAINRVQLSVRLGRLSPTETVRVEGVVVTDIARTLIDLGRWADVATAVVCMDAALRDGLVTPGELRSALDRAYSTVGVPRARIAVGFADGRSPGVAESRARVAARWPLPAVRPPRPGEPDEPDGGRGDRYSENGCPADRFPATPPPPDRWAKPGGPRRTPW